LRILPTGPAHQVLKMFRNRTVYANVVNDGIVPLRTSCLLFLDGRGLGKVEKARRENGLIGTVAEWGWAELTGANSSSVAPNVIAEQYHSDEDDEDEHVRRGEGDLVPQPAEDETAEDNRLSMNRTLSYTGNAESNSDVDATAAGASVRKDSQPQPQEKGLMDSFLDFFKSNGSTSSDKAKTPQQPSKKTSKTIRRAQTVYRDEEDTSDDVVQGQKGTTDNPTMRPHLHHRATGEPQTKRPVATKGDSFINNETGEVQAPPKTSIFESAGDILHPPLPSKQWITDPSSRSRTIFHDRVYHPEDIPPPPVKRSGSRLSRSFSSDALSGKGSHSSNASVGSIDSTDSGSMKVEEKIARAYHRDLSWRKVLVRLEPDAHNNIIVRRMFANAYGWPVIKHLCDTHFADTYAARTRDEEEPARERAQPMHSPVPETGEEVKDQTSKKVPPRTQSETREARDELADLHVSRHGAEGSKSSKASPRQRTFDRQNSGAWDDSVFDGSDGDDSDIDERNLVARILNPNIAPPKKPEQVHHRTSSKGSANGVPTTPTTPYTDAHRGLGLVSSSSPSASPASLRSPPVTRSTFDSGNIDSPSPVVDDHLTEEPLGIESRRTSTVAAVGLRKSVEEQMSPTKSRSK
jgi:hypothetical protein